MTKYNERFVKVIDYIEANLGVDLNLDELCNFVHLSKYHFHRQCSIFFGISVTSLIRMLRLKRAAYRLAYRNDSVIDIALDSGYESHEAFSRAFKKYFDQSPSDFRQSPDWTSWQLNYQPIVNLRAKMMSKNIDVVMVEFPETPLAVIEHRGSPALLAQTIQKFITWRKINGFSPDKSKTFNLAYDDPKLTEPDDFRFDIGCSIPEEIIETRDILNKIIPAGRCALVRHIGSDDSIGNVVNFLYSEWLPNSGAELRDFPIFFERVSFSPSLSEHETVTDIYLPIK